MTINTAHKERVLITIDKELMRILKIQNKKVFTTINNLLQKYLLEDYNQKINEVLMSNERCWKSISF